MNGCLVKMNIVAFFILRFESVLLLFLGDSERQNCEQATCFLRAIKGSIWREITNISRQNLIVWFRNIFRMYKACLEVGGQHLETVT